uniref:Uncharacterized protein n=1 Tax=Meloidogyne enterolobii TaxID=390850 RepID=A0A6V7UD52_MELEN|nr:unnamed protein product [Meloidogyne enterolobii]
MSEIRPTLAQKLNQINNKLDLIERLEIPIFYQQIQKDELAIIL